MNQSLFKTPTISGSQKTKIREINNSLNESMIKPQTQAARPATQKQQNSVFKVTDYMVPGTNERDIYIYKQIFDIMDKDNNGLIIPGNLRAGFLNFGYNVKREWIYQLFSELDDDESGGIEFQEFVILMVQLQCDKDTEEDIKKIYNQYDTDNKGYITKQDFEYVMQEIEEDLKPEQINEIFQKVDPEGNGVIRKDVFIRFHKKKEWDI